MDNFLPKGLLKAVVVFVANNAIAQGDVASKTSLQQTDSIHGSTASSSYVTVAANPQLKGTGFQKFMVGKNYRYEWMTPVRVPVLQISTAFGGLKPTREGGGKQTKSLRVEDQNGKEWALRSVEKFPEKAIPPELKKTVAQGIIEQGISASYPYAQLSTATLSKAAGVPYLKDSLIYIGDDPALGEYRLKYKNTLAWLEEKEPSGIELEVKDGKKEKLINSEELVYKLAGSSNNKVDQTAVLRARLLDNFIMDFDRHQGQWDWVGISSGEGKTYYPVPMDRDQAFYRLSGGLLSGIVTKGLPQIQGFRAKAKNINTFNKPEQGFDRFFLNSLSEEEWSRQIDEFLNTMTDEVIEAAMRQQPTETRYPNATKIINTLKEKRKYFKEDMLEYYRFISKRVSIVGTNNREQFSVSKEQDGKVHVTIHKIDSTGNLGGILYDRIFDPAVTHELRIYGLEGDDKFVVQGNKSDIKTRLIGGPGEDEFVNSGNGHGIVVYDVSFEQNRFSGDKGIDKKISDDPQNNNYTRLEYRYYKYGFGLAAEYTIGGLFVGPTYKIVTQRFRKEPYSSSHLFAVTRAIDVSSYHLRYWGDFIHVFGKTDLVFHSDAYLPTSRTLFFGMGNNSVFDKSKPRGHVYYFAPYNLVNVSLMARKRVNPWFQYSFGPVFQYFKLKRARNVSKYVAEFYANETNFNSPYTGKSFAGGELSFLVNTKNHPLVPTRGIQLNMYGRALAGVSKYANPVNEAGGQLDLFTDFIAKKHVVLATSIGGSHITGKFEIQQAQYLGFLQNLRGFRIDRFAGRSRVYNNSEIRFIKQDANLGLFRGSAGVFLFNDVARVWADNEDSDQWHDGYGWGVFIAPLNRMVLSATLMYSNEEKNLLYINFGFQF